MPHIHTFAGNPLDRADALRRDPDWLASAATAAGARYLAFWRLNVLIRSTNESEVAPQLAWIARDGLDFLTSQPTTVFLGLLEDVPHFAIDLSAIESPLESLGLGTGYGFEDSRTAAMSLSVEETGILAQARSQIDWHNRHRFCSVCGAPTEPRRGGHVRRCEACRSEHFPRTDPVAIMVIADGDRCLLGQSRGRLQNTGMYSALAGFIDQGESIEEAVRREVREEAGIEVGAVSYHSSQPWPFPSSLMIGCHGQAASTDVRIDPEEMADVRWFHRNDVLAALTESHASLRVPGPIAIAHHLIDAWAHGRVVWPGDASPA